MQRAKRDLECRGGILDAAAVVQQKLLRPQEQRVQVARALDLGPAKLGSMKGDNWRSEVSEYWAHVD